MIKKIIVAVLAAAVVITAAVVIVKHRGAKSDISPASETAETVPAEFTDFIPGNPEDRISLIEKMYSGLFTSDCKITKTVKASYSDAETEFSEADEAIALRIADEAMRYAESVYHVYKDTPGNEALDPRVVVLGVRDVTGFEYSGLKSDPKACLFRYNLITAPYPDPGCVSDVLCFGSNASVLEEVERKFRDVMEIGVAHIEMTAGSISGNINTETGRLKEITFSHTYTVNAVLTFIGDYSDLGVKHISFTYTADEIYTAEWQSQAEPESAPPETAETTGKKIKEKTTDGGIADV